LNGSGGWETLSLDFAHDIGWEASLVEGLDWSWDISALNGDGVFLSELGNIGFGTVRD
jgi:hypothetical protein